MTQKKNNRNSVFFKVELRLDPNTTKILLKSWFYERSQITWDFAFGLVWFYLFCFLYDSTLFFKDIDFFLTLLIILFYVRQTVILKPSNQISQSRLMYGSQKKTAENTKTRWTDTLIITLTLKFFPYQCDFEKWRIYEITYLTGNIQGIMSLIC